MPFVRETSIARTSLHAKLLLMKIMMKSGAVLACALVLAGCGASDAADSGEPAPTESPLATTPETEDASAETVHLSQVPDDEAAMAEACTSLFGDPVEMSPALGLPADVAWAPDHDAETGLEECAIAPANGLQDSLVRITLSTEKSGARIGAESPDGIWVQAWYEDVVFDQIPGDRIEFLQARVEAAAEAVKP